MGAESKIREINQKPMYDAPKALCLDDLNRGQGGQHGSVDVCTATGSGDSTCVNGGLPNVGFICLNPGSSDY